MKKRLSTVLMLLLAFMLSITFSITAYADELEEEEPEPDPLPPSRVILTNHFISGGGLAAGEQATVMIVLTNTSQESAVSSVLVTGRLEQEAPLVFVGANQAYIPKIGAGAEGFLRFEFNVQNIDLSLVDTISFSFTIEYFDESSWTERSNNVSLKLNVLSGAGVAISDEDMHFPIYEQSAIEELLHSPSMQTVYILGLIICCVGIALILLYRLLKRYVDWKGGKTNV